MKRRHRLIVATALLLALFASISFAKEVPKSLTMSAPPPYRYDFQLTKGKGTPVCDAYVQRLRATDFYVIPRCERPDNVSVPGFKPLGRVPLTRAEVLALNDSVQGLLFANDPGYAKARSLAEKTKRPFASDAALNADAQESSLRNTAGKSPARSPYYYRFEPRVDIDNDGVADDVVMWSQTASPCGQTYAPNYAYPRAVSVFPAILGEGAQLDVESTRALLQHPRGDVFYPPQRLALPVAVEFRKIADALGVFAYAGEYYLDGFYTYFGDLEGNSVRTSETTGVLAVFERKGGTTTAVCEVSWNDRKQR